MRVADEIEAKLRTAFEPTDIEVVDDSASHAGHAGAPDGGQSHFNVRIRAAAFGGQSRIAKHRAVHRALGPELIGRIHALALDISD
ncbi:MAG: BolA family protein [Pseudomonadota bacterium]